MKDSRRLLISLLRDIRLQKKPILVYFDVELLLRYHQPIPDTDKIIKEIPGAPDLTDLADECLQSTFFYFDGSYYEQTAGAAMGSPLSPVAANPYMESRRSGCEWSTCGWLGLRVNKCWTFS